jgi:hypothetical protein
MLITFGNNVGYVTDVYMVLAVTICLFLMIGIAYC